MNTRKSKLKITTVLPVSRTTYLEQVIYSLVNQTYKPDNLIVVFDGPQNEYLEVRNKVVALPFNVLCVPSNNETVAQSIPDRRRNIVNVHNQIRNLVNDCDLVWSIEDDGIIPLDALSKLASDINTLPNAGLVTGVELGRWGTPYVGAWVVDDVNYTTQISSLENRSLEGGHEPIDASGLYCALVRAELYKTHNFFTQNGLGPDVNLGLSIRQQGFNNYIDWSIHLTHLTHRGGEHREVNATDPSKVVTLTLLHGNTWQH
jgi:glycosyltransferase involved in cell wall biosynthesis